MDFTREPIVETIITPKEGCKLVIRSSKSAGQEEHFVDAVEVVSFGTALFFRSLERPKAFIVPASDYEVLEVREARIVLKNVGVDRSIKIGGGRDALSKPAKEAGEKPADQPSVAAEETQPTDDKRFEKKRDRRRQSRRRRGRDETAREEEAIAEDLMPPGQETKVLIPPPRATDVTDEQATEAVVASTNIFSSLLPPPPTLIRETIAKYKDNAMFKDAFYSQEETEDSESDSEVIESDSDRESGELIKKEGIQDLLDEDDELHMPMHNTPRFRSAPENEDESQEDEESEKAPEAEPFLSSESPVEQHEIPDFVKEILEKEEEKKNPGNFLISEDTVDLEQPEKESVEDKEKADLEHTEKDMEHTEKKDES